MRLTIYLTAAAVILIFGQIAERMLTPAAVAAESMDAGMMNEGAGTGDGMKGMKGMQPMAAHKSLGEGAQLNAENETTIPDGFRYWPFIGAPLTPHGLNNGAAGFPEFHHVYIEPEAFRAYIATGEFPEGTTIVMVKAPLSHLQIVCMCENMRVSCLWRTCGRGFAFSARAY